jgi:hypothetical protein
MSPLDQVLEVLSVLNGLEWISLMIAIMVAMFFLLRFFGRD